MSYRMFARTMLVTLLIFTFCSTLGVAAPSRAVVEIELVLVAPPANTTVVSLSSLSQFEIEANVAEADITKVSIGDEAVLTLDAFGEDIVFDAIVYQIDPAETIIEGVSTYTVTFQFTDDEGIVKSGMTADIDILTAKKEDVVAVPIRAVLGRGDNRHVRVLLDSGEVVERKVVVGLRGSRGDIEIVRGIEIGEKVVIFERE